MGHSREARKKRTRARMRQQIADLERRDALRRAELADADAALAEAWDRERRARERPVVELTETDYALE